MKESSSLDNPYEAYKNLSETPLLLSVGGIGRFHILSAFPALPPAASPIIVDNSHWMIFEFRKEHKNCKLRPIMKCILSCIKNSSSTYANCFIAAILFHTIFGLKKSSDYSFIQLAEALASSGVKGVKSIVFNSLNSFNFFNSLGHPKLESFIESFLRRCVAPTVLRAVAWRSARVLRGIRADSLRRRGVGERWRRRLER